MDLWEISIVTFPMLPEARVFTVAPSHIRAAPALTPATHRPPPSGIDDLAATATRLANRIERHAASPASPHVIAARLAGDRALASLIRLGLMELKRDSLKANFSPAQLRIPAGLPRAGEWTRESAEEQILRVSDRPGYPINILDEDALGGHTFDRHINKPEQYLKARITGSRRNLFGIVTYGEKRAGSFPSLEAANKLVNSTIAQHIDKVQPYVDRRLLYSLPVLYVHADFSAPTGYEAYAPTDNQAPRIRDTYGVTVRLIRSPHSPKGYIVHSAWPTNRD